MTSISNKIKSFIESGLIPGGKGLTNQKSFDSSDTDNIYLNSVTRTEGIALSLFHKAKGGLTVATEEQEGSDGIFDHALERNRAKISKKVEELRNTISEEGIKNLDLEREATHEVLKSDNTFIQELSEKAHKTALFLVNIDINPDEKDHQKGCKEITREETIPPEKFTHLIISEHYKDILKSELSKEEVESGKRRDRENRKTNSVSEEVSINPNITRIFVNTVNSTINFSYRTINGSTYSFEMNNVPIPNYENALLCIAEQKIQKPEENNDNSSSEEASILQSVQRAAINSALSKIPIICHMTRL